MAAEADMQALKQTVFGEQGSDAEAIKQKEEAVSKLSEAYVKQQDAKALTELLSELRPFFAIIPKAKTAKIVRNIIDQIAKVPNSTDIQVSSAGTCQHESGCCCSNRHCLVYMASRHQAGPVTCCPPPCWKLCRCCITPW
jgi:6-phosphogluconate dehydrogenase (decarboxylating)